MRLFAPIATVVLLLFCLVDPAPALDDRAAVGEMSPAQVGDRAAGLLADVQVAMEAIDRYRSRLATASAEDSLVLRLQIFTRQDRGMVDIHALADALVELEKADPQDELRARVLDAFEWITPGIWTQVGELSGEVDGLRALRPATAPGDRSALEDRINRVTLRLDTFYQMGATHLEKMVVLGQDTTAAKADFTSLLIDRADDLSGRIQLDLLRADELSQRLKDSPGDADVIALSTAVQKSIGRDTASLEITLDLMEMMGLETEDQRAQLLVVTQDISSGLLDVRVTVSLAARAWGSFRTWIVESGPKLLVKALVFLAIVFAGQILARLVRGAVEKGMIRANVKLSQLLQHMIVASSYNAVLALALMIALSQLGFSLGPLLAGFGVVGFILGFAMQDSLSNLAAGMMILVNRPYDVGDLVDVAGAFGKVETMSLVSTGILTLDNQKLVVPNSKIWGDIIKNVTDQNVRRVDMTFGISYSDDIPKAEKILEEILAGNERVLDDPKPVVRLHNLGDSSVDFIVRPWAKTEDYWEVFWDTTRAVKMRFDEEGVSIPFPQRDVHIFEEKVVRRERMAAGGEATAPVEQSDWQSETAPEPEEDA